MSAEPTAGGTTDPGGSVPTGQAPPPSGQEPGGEAAMTLEQALAALERTRREHAGTRSRLTTLERQQQEADAAKLSELEKAQKESTALKAQLAQRDHADLQREVAAEVGLPAQMASRLQGATREELQADAKALAKLIPAAAEQPAAFGANPANPARTNALPDMTIADLKSKPRGWFEDPKNRAIWQKALHRS